MKGQIIIELKKEKYIYLTQLEKALTVIISMSMINDYLELLEEEQKNENSNNN